MSSCVPGIILSALPLLIYSNVSESWATHALSMVSYHHYLFYKKDIPLLMWLNCKYCFKYFFHWRFFFCFTRCQYIYTNQIPTYFELQTCSKEPLFNLLFVVLLLPRVTFYHNQILKWLRDIGEYLESETSECSLSCFLMFHVATLGRISIS
jgi:hypothetical protein